MTTSSSYKEALFDFTLSLTRSCNKDINSENSTINLSCFVDTINKNSSSNGKGCKTSNTRTLYFLIKGDVT